MLPLALGQYTTECANLRRAIGKDGGGLKSENGGNVSSIREKKEARFVADISCDVIILRLCVARCGQVARVITLAERRAALGCSYCKDDGDGPLGPSATL